MPEATKTPIPVFGQQLTEAVCNILAATEYPGLTKSELVSALRPAKLQWEDGPNKRTALLYLLHNAQVERRRGDTLVAFVNAAMNPLRYVTDHARFDQLRSSRWAGSAWPSRGRGGPRRATEVTGPNVPRSSS